MERSAGPVNVSLKGGLGHHETPLPSSGRLKNVSEVLASEA